MILLISRLQKQRPHGQEAKTSPPHGENMSSILVGVIFNLWAFSSVGQSIRLITGWSRVQVPEGPSKFWRSSSAGESTRFIPEVSGVQISSPLLMREWLSGRASPCQGEGREFESRFALFKKKAHAFFFFCASVPDSFRIRTLFPCVAFFFVLCYNSLMSTGQEVSCET